MFLVFGAPVFMSGRATFAGYVKLDDTATYLAMLDRFMGHGYNTAGLAPSTYSETLNTSLALGYPMGSLVPLGIGHQLVRTDAAWLWQPYLTFLAAMLALALYGLLAPIVRSSRPPRPPQRSSPRSRRCSTGMSSGAASRRWPRRCCSRSDARSIPSVLEARRAREMLPLAVARRRLRRRC